jgi:hypothetical protein
MIVLPLAWLLLLRMMLETLPQLLQLLLLPAGAAAGAAVATDLQVPKRLLNMDIKRATVRCNFLCRDLRVMLQVAHALAQSLELPSELEQSCREQQLLPLIESAIRFR